MLETFQVKKRIILTNNLVNWIVIIEFDESESTLLATVLLGDDVDQGDASVLLEIVSQALFIVVITDSSNEQFLDGGPGVWTVDILTWDGSLRFNDSSIDFVWSLRLGFVYHARLGVGDETETTGSLGFWVFHDDYVDNLAPTFEMGL